MSNKKKILVTGGAGFIGSHTVVELFNAGYQPIIIDNFVNSSPYVLEALEKILGEQVKCHKIDCCDDGALAKVFSSEENFFGVIHFAAYKAVGESVEEPLKYYKNNIGSTVALLQAMLKYNINNLVYSSSCTVYGQPEKNPVNEESPVIPAESPYGKTKQICEEIIRDAINAVNQISNPTFKAISLRYFNPIGAHQSALLGELPLDVPNNLVPYITQTAAGTRKELTVFGNDYDTPDGSCIRDYIHVVDLAIAHVKAIEFHNNTGYEVFNIGTGNGNSVLEVVETFEKVTGLNLKYKIGKRRQGDITKIYAEVNKAKKVLGWETKLTLEDALRDAWNWQLQLKNIKI
ncbi:MAG: UDP-glucose 4-epimerase GalE [Cytophagales bacterium]|nr:UDP-glucose 4-epimerase GalE [Cytophagales bacterium]